MISTVTLERRKQRHCRLILPVGAVTAVLTVWTLGLVWERNRRGILAQLEFVLLELHGMLVMIAPVLAAVIAARLVAVDQQERMEQVFAALGQPRLTRFWGKLALANLITLACLAITTIICMAFGLVIGMPVTSTLGITLTRLGIIVVLSTLSVTAFQLGLAMRFPERPIGMIAAVVGAFVASALEPLNIPAVGWALPWGVLVSASPMAPISAYSPGDTALLTTDSAVVDTIAAALLVPVWTVIAAGLAKHTSGESR